MFSEIFSAYKHGLAGNFRYLGNKKPTFLTCNHKLVYAAIWESSKNNDLLRTSKRTLKISLTFL